MCIIGLLIKSRSFDVSTLATFVHSDKGAEQWLRKIGWWLDNQIEDVDLEVIKFAHRLSRKNYKGRFIKKDCEHTILLDFLARKLLILLIHLSPNKKARPSLYFGDNSLMYSTLLPLQAARKKMHAGIGNQDRICCFLPHISRESFKTEPTLNLQ